MFFDPVAIAADIESARNRTEALLDFVDREVFITPKISTRHTDAEQKIVKEKIKENCVERQTEPQTQVINEFTAAVLGMPTTIKIRATESARQRSILIENQMKFCAENYGYELSVKEVLRDGRKVTWSEIFQKMMAHIIDAEVTP